MDSIQKFNVQSLPPNEDFYSILTDEHITSENYEHAQKVWDTFNLKSMGEYHDLYLKSDVLLLADVFEKFRSTCLQYYQLDPTQFYTSPGLSWNAMLKMTNIELELMSDIDQYLFLLKKESEVEFHIFVNVMPKQTINILRITIQTNHQTTLCTLMQIIYMDGQ